MAGSIPTRRQRSESFFKELPHLRLTALDPREHFDGMLGFLDGRRGMGVKVGFQGGVVRLELTHRALDSHRFEAVHPTLTIELEVVPQRVLRDADHLGDLAMREAMTLQPQRFHAPLDQGHRMVIALIVQGGLKGRGKLQLHRHGYSLPNALSAVTKTAIPPRGQYRLREIDAEQGRLVAEIRENDKRLAEIQDDLDAIDQFSSQASGLAHKNGKVDLSGPNVERALRAYEKLMGKKVDRKDERAKQAAADEFVVMLLKIKNNMCSSGTTVESIRACLAR